MGRARVFVQAPAIFDRNHPLIGAFLFTSIECHAEVVVPAMGVTDAWDRHCVLESHKNGIMAA
jgi:hypothetical protein